MLKLTSLVTILFSVNAFASTNGGGILIRNTFARPSNNVMTGAPADDIGGSLVKAPEIVYHLGQKDGLVKFAHGQLQGNRWQIQKIQVPLNELALTPEEVTALKASEVTKDWVYIK